MKSILSIFLLLPIFCYAQITSPTSTDQIQTQYTDGNQNDEIFIFCNSQGELNVTPNGNGPFTFTWYQYDDINNSWTNFTTQNGNQSNLQNLTSGGYRVVVEDNSGNLVFCDAAWVWNISIDVTANNNFIDCETAELVGTNQFQGENFTYYNLPPDESLVDQNTEITVCFDADHTYVSDLGFVLVGPPGCGSPAVTLMPNSQAVNNANGCCCNSGNNINDLCFSTSFNLQIDFCASATPLTGDYGFYNGNFPGTGGGNYPQGGIQDLYGCNAAEGGWSVQIFDCIGADVGALTEASIEFSNLSSVCGNQTSILYESGAINSAINDNSCSQNTASIYQVPLSPILTQQININIVNTIIWTNNNNANIISPNQLNTQVNNISGQTDFTFTSQLSLNGNVICESSETTTFNAINNINIGPILHD